MHADKISMKRTILISTILILSILSIVAGWALYGYKSVFSDPWMQEEVWIYIHKNDNQKIIVEQLKNSGNDTDSFWFGMACQVFGLEKSLQRNIAGAYHIEKGRSIAQVIRKFTHHQQDPVKLTFIGARTLEDLAGRMAEVVEADSLQILQAMHNPEFLAECNCNEANLPGIFLPDTYEIYWNISPEKLMKRMLAEYKKFWNEDRMKLTHQLGLNPQQVSIICSIAEEETANRKERGIVARLYWNRFHIGMLLQADPTVKFAVGDFTLRRILTKHLKVESPYNTYIHAGLPPGPIRIVEKATIDSFLHSEPHKYLYMCAKEDFSGLHNFATTLRDHQRNATKYHQALTKRGIK